MLDSEILQKMQGASIKERIRIIEMVLTSLKQNLRASNAQAVAAQRPLRGTVRHDAAPYQPVAASDWIDRRTHEAGARGCRTCGCPKGGLTLQTWDAPNNLARCQGHSREQ